MNARHRTFQFLLAASLAFYAYADAPMGPPQRRTVCSTNHKFCATADPATSATKVHEAETANALWEVSGADPYIYVSNDGEILVVGYSGFNLVPVDVSVHESMLRFYVHGKLVRTVELGEWFPNPSLIKQTISHRSWGNIEALTESNHLIVRLSDGRRVSYDASSGSKEAQ